MKDCIKMYRNVHSCTCEYCVRLLLDLVIIEEAGAARFHKYVRIIHTKLYHKIEQMLHYSTSKLTCKVANVSHNSSFLSPL